MKFTKLSLIAALLLGSSTMFAIENTKVSGDARLYYGTQDSDAADAPNLFSKEAGYTNFAARLDITSDLAKNVSAGVGAQVVTTLGVEHNLVDRVWSNAHTVDTSTGASFASGAEVDSAFWIDEAWIAANGYDSTLKIGRQALDTPLAFTETWGVDKNTFEAVLLANKSLKDTTLIATYIGKSNGSADDRESLREGGAGNLNNLRAAAAGYVAADGRFNTFGTNGTYAFGIVNNSFKPLTAQAWYYNMVNLANAYWLQADIKCQAIDGLIFGVQYVNTDLEKGANIGYFNGSTTQVITGDTKDTSAWAAMVGYKLKDGTIFKVAYSDVDNDGTLGVANTATGSIATAGGQSKLYTEMWWNYGYVSAVGAESFALSAQTKLADIDFLLGYYNADISRASTLFAKENITEIALVASKSFGPLDTSLALIHANKDEADIKTTDIQVYLKYNF